MPPDFESLVYRALALGLDVQVCSNLYRASHKHWTLFKHPKARCCHRRGRAVGGKAAW